VSFQVLVKLERGLVAVRRVRFEAMLDDRFDGRGDGLVPAHDPRGWLATILDELVDHGLGGAVRDRERPPAGQQLVEDDSDRVEVAAGVERVLTAPAGVEVLRRHVEQRPAGRGHAGGGLEVLREVEIEQHRLTLVGQQDVLGLQVEVQDPPLVGVGQPAGHARGHPEDGLDISESLDVLQGGGGGPGPRGDRDSRRGLLRSLVRPRHLLIPGRTRLLKPVDAALALVEGAQEAPPGYGQRPLMLQVVVDVPQGGRPEIGHAHSQQSPDAVDRVDGDDVGVLQLGERLRLVEADRRDLQRDGTRSQVVLACKVHPAERPPAQLPDQPEAQELTSHLGLRRQADHRAIRRLRVAEVDVPELPRVVDAAREGRAPQIRVRGGALFPGPPELAIREVSPFHPLVAGTAEIGVDPRLPEHGILRGTT
jgi:hypothetical protein